jgi:hypothetical protein
VEAHDVSGLICLESRLVVLKLIASAGIDVACVIGIGYLGGLFDWASKICSKVSDCVQRMIEA